MTIDFTNHIPIVDPVVPEGAPTQLLAPEGADSVTHGAFTYAVQPDRSVIVPESIVQHLTHGAGFKLAPLSQAKRLAMVFDAIKALDPGPIRTALWTATIEQSLKLAGLSASSPSPAPAA